jgi:hypothetical protein
VKQVASLACSSTLKMEAICSSETSVDFQWTTRRYIPEGVTLQRTCTHFDFLGNLDMLARTGLKVQSGWFFTILAIQPLQYKRHYIIFKFQF